MTTPTIQPTSDDAATGVIDSRCQAAATGTGPLVLVAALFIIACLCHGLLVRSGLDANTAWFSLTGTAFLLVTVGSHMALCRQQAATPLVPLMIAMMVRLTGTFLILGCLLAFSPLSRPEAVFNVLFWYITLTAADLIGVTRTR